MNSATSLTEVLDGRIDFPALRNGLVADVGHAVGADIDGFAVLLVRWGEFGIELFSGRCSNVVLARLVRQSEPKQELEGIVHLPSLATVTQTHSRTTVDQHLPGQLHVVTSIQQQLQAVIRRVQRAVDPTAAAISGEQQSRER